MYTISMLIFNEAASRRIFKIRIPTMLSNGDYENGWINFSMHAMKSV